MFPLKYRVECMEEFTLTSTCTLPLNFPTPGHNSTTGDKQMLYPGYICIREVFQYSS